MEPLRLFATYETLTPLPAQAEHLRGRGWSAIPQNEGLICRQGGVQLRLESSGGDLYLLRGEVDCVEKDAAMALLADFLRTIAQVFQVDVFEEDGRLVRRISSTD